MNSFISKKDLETYDETAEKLMKSATKSQLQKAKQLAKKYLKMFKWVGKKSA